MSKDIIIRMSEEQQVYLDYILKKIEDPHDNNILYNVLSEGVEIDSDDEIILVNGIWVWDCASKEYITEWLEQDYPHETEEQIQKRVEYIIEKRGGNQENWSDNILDDIMNSIVDPLMEKYDEENNIESEVDSKINYIRDEFVDCSILEGFNPENLDNEFTEIREGVEGCIIGTIKRELVDGDEKFNFTIRVYALLGYHETVISYDWNLILLYNGCTREKYIWNDNERKRMLMEINNFILGNSNKCSIDKIEYIHNTINCLEGIINEDNIDEDEDEDDEKNNKTSINILKNEYE
jgi:hypothetical protein